MDLALEALSVDLVDVLRAGGPSRKPAAGCYDFQAANGSMIARSVGQLGGNRLVRQIRLLYRVG